MSQEDFSSSSNSLSRPIIDAVGSGEPHPTANAASTQPPERFRLWLGVVSVLLITAVAFWLAFNSAWLTAQGHWGYIGAFVISMVASATVLLPAPGMAIVVSMGTALNPLLLALAAGLGSATGEFTGYLAGATGQALIPQQHRHRYEQFRELTQRHGALLLFFFSAIPFPLFDLAGMVAGALKMNPLSFFAAVTAGKSIKYTVLIVLGASTIQYIQQWLEQTFF